jgi:tyrosyl-tRNA synthetase
LAESSSAARRLIRDRAVRLDGEVVPAGALDQPRSALVGTVLAVGKRRAVRLVQA